MVATKSRADGGFSVDVPADTKRMIRVSARGWVPVEVQVPASPENLELEVGRWPDGVRDDALSGAPPG